MQIIECKCVSCKAPLQLNLDDIQMYCPYCGNKILIESATLATILAEKEKTYRLKMQHEHEEKMFKAESIEREKADKRKARTEHINVMLNSDLFRYIFVAIFLIVIVCVIGINVKKMKDYEDEEYRFGMPILSSDAEGKKLVTIYDLFFDAGCRNIEVEATDDLSETEKSINEGEVVRVLVNGSSNYNLEPIYEYVTNDPSIIIVFYTPDGKMPFPFSSDSVAEQDAQSVIRKLLKNGFYNIQTKYKKSVFNEKGTVMKMMVDGNKKFSTTDRFDLGIPIVIEAVEY